MVLIHMIFSSADLLVVCGQLNLAHLCGEMHCSLTLALQIDYAGNASLH